MIDECSSLVGEVLLNVRVRYGESLQSGGSGNKIKDVYKRVEFSLREKEKLQLLQEKLNGGIGRLSLLSSCAALFVCPR